MADESALGGAARSARRSSWRRLRSELERLAAAPGLLVRSPGTDSEDLQPPFEIQLAAYALDTAMRLYAEFGDEVELRVGALPYPPKPGFVFTERAADGAALPALDRGAFAVALDGPLRVMSGHVAVHGLLLTNLTNHAVTVLTNGHVTAQVVDPGSGSVVGGYVGPQLMPLVSFRAAPGATVRIPLLVGTASFDYALGYAVPPGRWEVLTALRLAGDDTEHPSNATTFSCPALPLAITETGPSIS